MFELLVIDDWMLVSYIVNERKWEMDVLKLLINDAPNWNEFNIGLRWGRGRGMLEGEEGVQIYLCDILLLLFEVLFIEVLFILGLLLMRMILLVLLS